MLPGSPLPQLQRLAKRASLPVILAPNSPGFDIREALSVLALMVSSITVLTPLLDALCDL